APSGGYGSGNAMMNQPGAGGNYVSVPSPARSSAAPSAVQRRELVAPGATTTPGSDFDNRQQAMEQPFPSQPAQQSAGRSVEADNIVTGTVKPTSGWSAVNAPKVTLKPGESAATLSRRYGVPESEILKANGGRLVAGQSVVIPTFGPARNSAKVASGDINLQDKIPAPARKEEQKVAVLPGAARDKAQSEVAKVTPPAGSGDSYVVKP